MRFAFTADHRRRLAHQGLGGNLLISDAAAANDNRITGAIKSRSRLASTLNFYRREAT